MPLEHRTLNLVHIAIAIREPGKHRCQPPKRYWQGTPLARARIWNSAHLPISPACKAQPPLQDVTIEGNVVGAAPAGARAVGLSDMSEVFASPELEAWRMPEGVPVTSASIANSTRFPGKFLEAGVAFRGIKTVWPLMHACPRRRPFDPVAQKQSDRIALQLHRVCWLLVTNEVTAWKTESAHPHTNPMQPASHHCPPTHTSSLHNQHSHSRRPTSMPCHDISTRTAKPA